jgi:hypothetical protein
LVIIEGLQFLVTAMQGAVQTSQVALLVANTVAATNQEPGVKPAPSVPEAMTKSVNGPQKLLAGW